MVARKRTMETRPGRPLWSCALVLAVMSTMLAPLASVSVPARAQGAGDVQSGAKEGGGVKTGPSGLPLPRFASLKADRVNMRKGPGTQYPIAWVYRQAGLPVEIINEFENWREVRDGDGTTGWIFRPMLSNRRTAQVVPWQIEKGKPPPLVEVKESRGSGSRAVVTVEAGVIANVRSCDGSWCHISIGSHVGHIEQDKLWGVYKTERLR